MKQARPDFWDYSYKTDFGAEKRKFYSWGPGDYYAGDYSVPISISIGDEGFTCNIGYTDMLNPLAWKRCLSYPSGGQKYTKADLALDLNRFIDDGTLTREQAELIVETFEEPETSTISKPRDRPDKESRAYLPGYWNPGYYKVPVYSKYPGKAMMRVWVGGMEGGWVWHSAGGAGGRATHTSPRTPRRLLRHALPAASAVLQQVRRLVAEIWQVDPAPGPEDQPARAQGDVRARTHPAARRALFRFR